MTMFRFHRVVEMVKCFDDMGANLDEMVDEMKMLIGDPMYFDSWIDDLLGNDI